MKKLWSIGIIALLFLLVPIWRTDAQDKQLCASCRSSIFSLAND